VIQLAVIALILHGIFQQPWTAALFLLVMIGTASFVSARRLVGLPYGGLAAVTAIALSAGLVIVLVFALRMLELSVPNVIALGGIVIGNTMTAVTLTGRRFMAGSRTGRAEVEGWFALGARPHQAFAEVGRVSVREMLIPSLDQTKSTGLVTLPGAFVGAIMGGASPLGAAQFQLVVLIGVMLAQTIAGLITVRLVSRARTIVADAKS
jgi:putative ABC transport system permease protein